MESSKRIYFKVHAILCTCLERRNNTLATKINQQWLLNLPTHSTDVLKRKNTFSDKITKIKINISNFPQSR